MQKWVFGWNVSDPGFLLIIYHLIIVRLLQLEQAHSGRVAWCRPLKVVIQELRIIEIIVETIFVCLDVVQVWGMLRLFEVESLNNLSAILYAIVHFIIFI